MNEDTRDDRVTVVRTTALRAGEPARSTKLTVVFDDRAAERELALAQAVIRWQATARRDGAVPETAEIAVSTLVGRRRKAAAPNPAAIAATAAANSDYRRGVLAALAESDAALAAALRAAGLL